MEALLSRFRDAHTQVLGVSVDSHFSHANWGRDLGGVSFPLLADFHPKGEMAKSYGLYLEDNGITDRATVIIDKDGIVRYANSVTPGGKRDISELAAQCEKVDKEHGGGLPEISKPKGLPEDAVLYVKSQCGFSRAAVLARDNLHLGKMPVRNITEDPKAKEELKKAAGKDQAPCLLHQGKCIQDSAEIIKFMTSSATDLPG